MEILKNIYFAQFEAGDAHKNMCEKKNNMCCYFYFFPERHVPTFSHYIAGYEIKNIQESKTYLNYKNKNCFMKTSKNA